MKCAHFAAVVTIILGGTTVQAFKRNVVQTWQMKAQGEMQSGGANSSEEKNSSAFHNGDAPSSAELHATDKHHEGIEKLELESGFSYNAMPPPTITNKADGETLPTHQYTNSPLSSEERKKKAGYDAAQVGRSKDDYSRATNNDVAKIRRKIEALNSAINEWHRNPGGLGIKKAIDQLQAVLPEYIQTAIKAGKQPQFQAGTIPNHLFRDVTDAIGRAEKVQAKRTLDELKKQWQTTRVGQPQKKTAIETQLKDLDVLEKVLPVAKEVCACDTPTLDKPFKGLGQEQITAVMKKLGI